MKFSVLTNPLLQSSVAKLPNITQTKKRKIEEVDAHVEFKANPVPVYRKVGHLFFKWFSTVTFLNTLLIMFPYFLYVFWLIFLPSGSCGTKIWNGKDSRHAIQLWQQVRWP